MKVKYNLSTAVATLCALLLGSFSCCGTKFEVSFAGSNLDPIRQKFVMGNINILLGGRV